MQINGVFGLYTGPELVELGRQQGRLEGFNEVENDWMPFYEALYTMASELRGLERVIWCNGGKQTTTALIEACGDFTGEADKVESIMLDVQRDAGQPIEIQADFKEFMEYSANMRRLAKAYFAASDSDRTTIQADMKRLSASEPKRNLKGFIRQIQEITSGYKNRGARSKDGWRYVADDAMALKKTDNQWAEIGNSMKSKLIEKEKEHQLSHRDHEKLDALRSIPDRKLAERLRGWVSDRKRELGMDASDN